MLYISIGDSLEEKMKRFILAGIMVFLSVAIYAQGFTIDGSISFNSTDYSFNNNSSRACSHNVKE